MAKQEVLKVHPAKHQDAPAERHVDKFHVVENFESGLEITLTQFPALAGTLQTNQKDNSLWVLCKREHSVELTVNQIDTSDDAFHSYEALDEADFPAAMLDGKKLLPKAVTEV